MNRLFLSKLGIKYFRNLLSVAVEPSERFNVISGKNGSGKTNLLESIYFFSILRSFRTVLRREVVCEGHTESSLKAVFGGSASGLSVDIVLGTALRRILKDGKEMSTLDDHFYQLPMVLFHPANMSLVQGGPKERRRFLDRALFQSDRSFPSLSSDYNRALMSRNRLLKSRNVEKSLLEPFDIQLSRLGASIVESRARFVDKARGIFSETVGEIGHGIRGEMQYVPNVEGDEDAFLSALSGALNRDSVRGFTSVGPHADELEILVDGRAAKRYASQGQQRVVVLSLKISEVLVLSDVTQRIPILLLDDISSELDRDRNRALFAFLKGVGGQVFITTTHLDHVLLDGDRKDFFIEGGQLLDSYK